MIIAIDGPSASGKSTTAQLLAEKLGYLHIDTGAMYRAVTLYLIQNRIPLDDLSGIEAAVADIRLNFNEHQEILLNDRNVSAEIRTDLVNHAVSQVSAVPAVRKRLVELQRAISRDHDIVMEGRDIGTQVFPDADYKIFIIADIKERSERRYQEMKAKGISCSLENVYADLEKRDQFDSSRKHSPLVKADDAIVIDTTRLTIDQQVSRILEIVNK